MRERERVRGREEKEREGNGRGERERERGKEGRKESGCVVESLFYITLRSVMTQYSLLHC